MRLGNNANVNSVTSGASVKGSYSLFAFKKANQLQKDAALQLINSVPKATPLGKNKVNILA